MVSRAESDWMEKHEALEKVGSRQTHSVTYIKNSLCS